MGRSSSGMYRVLPNNRTELIEAERPIGGLQLGEATYQPGVPHTGCGVFSKERPRTLTYQSQIVFRNRGTGQLDRQRYLEDATSTY